MKDKLVKTNHKKGYYRFRAFTRSFAFAVILALGSALPIAVVANASAKEANAQEAVAVEVADLDVSSSEVEVVESVQAD